MTTELREANAAARKKTGRIATRQELTSFYQAIGIPAVASAMQAAKMTKAASNKTGELPAFLRDAHAVG